MFSPTDSLSTLYLDKRYSDSQSSGALQIYTNTHVVQGAATVSALAPESTRYFPRYIHTPSSHFIGQLQPHHGNNSLLWNSELSSSGQEADSGWEMCCQDLGWEAVQLNISPSISTWECAEHSLRQVSTGSIGWWSLQLLDGAQAVLEGRLLDCRNTSLLSQRLAIHKARPTEHRQRWAEAWQQAMSHLTESLIPSILPLQTAWT